GAREGRDRALVVEGVDEAQALVEVRLRLGLARAHRMVKRAESRIEPLSRVDAAMLVRPVVIGPRRAGKQRQGHGEQRNQPVDSGHALTSCSGWRADSGI